MMDPLMRLAAILAGVAASIFLAAAGPATAALPPIKHVWVVVLENKSYDTTFGSSPGSPYLGTTLPASGELMTQYYGIGHSSLDNYIAMISGQPPTPQTQGDCTTYSEFVRSGPDADGVAQGSGCVYPSDINTIGNQLEGKGLTWKQYAQDMASTSTEPHTCRHPAIGTADQSEGAKPDGQYATKHVPFVYFHSIIDRQSNCDSNVVDLSALPGDLASASTTPTFSFISPDLCADGHDASCADGTSPGGYQGIDNFLKTWIPQIVYSPAYADGGLIIVTFDEASGDATSCCGEPQSPNLGGGQNGGSGPGGGRTGTVLLSRYIKPGTVNNTPYNHYSMLRSLEDLFGLPYLGYAGQSGLQAFGADVFTQPTGSPPVVTPPKPTVSLKNVPGAGKCSPKSFSAKIKATSSQLRDVRVFLDGKRIALKTKLSFSLSVSTRKLKRGKHKLLARATDKLGRRAEKSQTFKKC
jgi:phosphatidylinositol-3-phosphatase